VIVLDNKQLYADLKYVSDRCRDFRKKAGRSQYEFSELTGMSYNTISRIENELRIPDIEQLLRYCYALDIPITDFLSPESQSLGISKQSLTLKRMYHQLSDPNKEFVLSAMSAMINGLLSQQHVTN